MFRFICLLLPFAIWAQPFDRPIAPVFDSCELKISAVVSVQQVQYTFWVSFSGPCDTVLRDRKKMVMELLSSFLSSVLALFPGQQPQIVSWTIEWG